MTTYTYAQLEGLWIQAGGRKSLAPLMAAIAEAESGGRTDARNPSGATGLWQILGAVNPADQSRLTNPQVNAHEAVLKYRDQGLGAWATYTSGAYKKYLRGKAPPPVTTGPGPVHTTSFLGNIFGIFSADTFERVGLVIFGGLLVVVGVLMITGGKTLEVTGLASKPKENGGSKGEVRRQEGGGSVLRNGAGTEEQASRDTEKEAA